MKKAYILPEANLLKISLFEDFLGVSQVDTDSDGPGTEQDNTGNDMGGSTGGVATGGSTPTLP